MGSFAVQIANALGAHVSAVASATKLDLLRSLGAGHAIDYNSNYLTDSERKFDLIIDIGGRNKVSLLRNVLAMRGTLVFIGGESGNRVTGGIGRQLGSIVVAIAKATLSSVHQ